MASTTTPPTTSPSASASDTSLSSALITPSLPYESRWVSHGTTSIKSAERLQVYGPPAIFQVPEELRKRRPEAFTPQQIGLGPYHHLRPDFYRTDTFKRDAVKKFMAEYPGSTFQNCLNSMKNVETVVRASYYKYLDLEESTVQYIMAVDSLFFLSFLTSNLRTNNAIDMAELAKDVVMLENQIPAAALKQVAKELYLFSNMDELYTHHFYNFCNQHSPLAINPTRLKRSKHLLAYMYHLILENGTTTPLPINNNAASSSSRSSKTKSASSSSKSQERRPQQRQTFSIIVGLVRSLVALLIGVLHAINEQHKNFIRKPAARVIDVFNSNICSLIPDPEIAAAAHELELIQFPSASELTAKFKVEILPTADGGGGITDIEFQAPPDTKKTQLRLPVITMRHNSQVVLMNLVAYETTVKKSSDLTDYVDLMCDLVTTHKDVELLRKSKVIKVMKGTQLSDEEIARMFNGIRRQPHGSNKPKGKSSSQRAWEDVYKMAERWENKNLRKRAYKFWCWCARCGLQFLKTTLQGLIYMYMIAQLGMQLFLIYCHLFGGGCTKEGSKRTYIANLISTHMLSYE